MDATPARRRRAPLTEAQRALAADYVPLARALSKPLKAALPEARDEFESAALLALVEAAESFDPDRGIRFSTFARHRIRGALRDVQRSLVVSGWRDDASNAPCVGHLVPELEQHGRVLGIQPDAPVGEDLEQTEAIERWLRRLPPKHAAACRQIYLHGKSQGEAARTLGCSQSRLSYMHREAMAMLNGTWYTRPWSTA